MKFQIYADTRGEYRWRLRANNDQIIATSGEGYRSKQSCQHGIDLVKAYAATAPVEDLTAQASYARR